MSLADFQERVRKTTTACGLDQLTLDGRTVDLASLGQAAQDTFSPESLRHIASSTMKVMAVAGVLDGVFQQAGIDLLNGSLFDLAAALVEHGGNAADLIEHSGNLAEAAGHAGDVGDAVMHVATGGLTIFTSMAASYLVGKYVQNKRDKRLEELQIMTVELIRRQAYVALKEALHLPGCSPMQLAQPVLYLLKAGDAPTVLV